MTSKPKWRRPRFSIRVLLVFVAIAGAYFGCWRATQQYGVDAVKEWDDGDIWRWRKNVRSYAPLIVVADERIVDGPDSGDVFVLHKYRSYYVWFFGPVWKAPYSRELSSKPFFFSE